MAASKRFICIHGHFYQPPRENPWLETVETQDSAAPYHDWNERVCAECYATNGAARIVNSKNQITRIVNNYARISFNFGPTLLSWLKENAPRTYRMIQDGERRSRKSFKGHSSAMAQVYNHVILPLANRRDRITQIRWGIADYQRHYGVPPEGMWLAETAADTESLELLAQHGIKFTVLAPHQCRHIRSLKDGGDWTETPNASVDTTHPYLVRFDSGVSIAVFFYDGAASRAIAFEGLLNSGESFAARLKGGFKDNAQPQLVHVATDGESYGHHHRYGEMALSYALRLLEGDRNVKLTNYGCFLTQFPPEYEARDCGQHVVELRARSGTLAVELRLQRRQAGLEPGLARATAPGAGRGARCLIPLTEQEGGKLFRDVWAARDGYIQVVLDRSAEARGSFLPQASEPSALRCRARARAGTDGDAAPRPADVHQLRMVLRRHLRHRDGADHRLCRARAATGAGAVWRAGGGAGARVSGAAWPRRIPTLPSAGDGARIYKEQVSFDAVGSGAGGSPLRHQLASFPPLPRRRTCSVIASGASPMRSIPPGRGRLALGRARIVSAITGLQQGFSFAVLHFGDQNITAAVKGYDESEAEQFAALSKQIAASVVTR